MNVFFKKLPINIVLICIGFLNQLTYISNAKENSNNNFRIVALTSLSADLVNQINNRNLVGIPGSSLIRKNNDFDNITIVSRGRMQPDLEKIINLNPNLVIGASGFHDKTLSEIKRLGINTLSTNIKSLDSLDNFYKELQRKLEVNNLTSIKEVLKNCYPNYSTSKRNNKEVVALVSVKPILSPGSTSWAGSLISNFRLNNLSANIQNKTQFKGYTNLSLEWLLKAKPNNLILIKTPGSDISQYKDLPVWQKLPAVKNNKIFEFDYYGLINPGNLVSIDNACKKLALI